MSFEDYAEPMRAGYGLRSTGSKTPARSDQSDDFPLGLMIPLDVARRRPQARMPGELLGCAMG
jgi:hypothetical protein